MQQNYCAARSFKTAPGCGLKLSHGDRLAGPHWPGPLGGPPGRDCNDNRGESNNGPGCRWPARPTLHPGAARLGNPAVAAETTLARSPVGMSMVRTG